MCMWNRLFFFCFSFFSFGLLVAGPSDEYDSFSNELADVFKSQDWTKFIPNYENLEDTQKEVAKNEFMKQYAQERFKEYVLIERSLVYKRLPDRWQKMPAVKSFILPSEGAILVAGIGIAPRLFTAIFCDGIMQEGALRLYKKLHNMIYPSHLIITSDIPEALSLDNLVLEPDVARQLLISTSAFSNIIKNKGRAQFNGLLFYGAPGTGKTEAARVMASIISKQHDISYIELSGDVLSTASREELRDLIDSLKCYRRPTIVLIDECEKFLLDRRLNLRSGEKLPEGLSEWLNFTSKPSKNIQFIYTTNYREKIDKAMLRRGQPVEFLLPGLENRTQLLYNYFDKIFLKDAFYTEEERLLMCTVFTVEYFKGVAAKLVYTKTVNNTVVSKDVFSPANIECIMNDVKSFSIAVHERGVPTLEIFATVIDKALAVKRDEVETEERMFGSPHSVAKSSVGISLPPAA